MLLGRVCERACVRQHCDYDDERHPGWIPVLNGQLLTPPVHERNHSS
jgi:hypothetical protein